MECVGFVCGWRDDVGVRVDVRVARRRRGRVVVGVFCECE